jgi:hypothetical protein
MVETRRVQWPRAVHYSLDIRLSRNQRRVKTMPEVKGKKFPYTEKGMKDADMAKKKMAMSGAKKMAAKKMMANKMKGK